MARQLEAPGDQIRVLFRAEEAEDFLRGWDPVPAHGGDDALNRAIQQSFDALNDAFPDAGQCVEIFALPAPRVEDGGAFDWHAVNFRFTQKGVQRVGHDSEALADWITQNIPDLVFAFEDAEGQPVRLSDIES